MKRSIAEVRRRLPVGKEFTGEFVGTNRNRCAPGMQVTRRKVIKNTVTQLVSELLDGPKAGERIYLGWQNLTADEREGAIYLTMHEGNLPEEFLKVTAE